jgi:Apg6 BARA domain
MADTERLLAESLMYEHAIRDDAEYKKGWKQMMYRAAVFDSDREEKPTHEGPEIHDGSILNAEHNIEETYMREIHLLEQACREQRDELKHLSGIQKEQVIAYEELQQFSESLAAEENALELEAKAFDNDQEQLSRMLGEINNEIDRLTSSDIRLPSLLVQLHIDVERGLRYPLINELRLAYRPKGDVHQMEIQAAWALAAYLLLVITSIFQFQSQNWKIVPLSHCAKLIFCPPSSDDTKIKNEKNRIVVFNLGHPKTNGSKALLAWNALLCQVTEHVKHKTSDAVQNGILDVLEVPQMPFEISPNSIGGVQLTQLNESDDSGWSRVIHFMASNLQWLSKCASLYVVHQVVLLTPLQAVEAKALSA